MSNERSEDHAVLTAPPMQWDAWGAPEKHKVLSDGIKGLLQQALGVTIREPSGRAADDAVLAPSALSDQHVTALAGIVGEQFASTAHTDRLLRSGGKSTLDLLRRRSTEPQNAPDAVVTPGTDAEVADVLRYCAANGIAVVPFGGGTSVVGGLDPVRDRFDAVVSLDLRRFDSLIDLDTDSGIATLGAGVTGPLAEELLGAHGFSLGHFPQSFMFATIGGFAATRSSGQASAGYGRFEDMVQGLRVVTPTGTLDTGRAPASAQARTSANCSSGRRARSASSPGCGSACTRSRPPPCGRAGVSPTSRPARPRCARCGRRVRSRPCCDCPTRPRRR